MFADQTALRLNQNTTNFLESPQALVGQQIVKLDCSRTSDREQRWLGAALLDIEPLL